MNYQFVHTVHGPAVFGDGELLFFFQVPQLVDYVDSNPQFIAEAREFLKERIKALSDTAISHIDIPAAGFDETATLSSYVASIEMLFRLEQEAKALTGFPGQNPQF